MKKIIILFSLFSATFLNSCSKIETEIDLLPIDYLTAGNIKTWKLSYYTENGQDRMLDCLSDDTFIFRKKEGKYEWIKGPKVCVGGDKDLVFDFKLSPDAKTLDISGSEYKINKLDINTLEIERHFSNSIQILGYSINK